MTRAIFPDRRVRLSVGSPGVTATASAGSLEAGRGWRMAARYAIVPSPRRARFLLPVRPRRVAVAAMLAYNALRPAKVRAARASIGMLARIGGLDLVRFPVLTVSIPDESPAAELLLTEQLAAVLGVGPLHAACGIRPPDPNHKPTLQLFDEAGRPRGYAKIGWNDATRRLVRAEARALRDLPRPDEKTQYPLTPRLLTDGEWCGQSVAIIEPLPLGVRGLSPAELPRFGAMLAVARQGGPPARPRPVAGSGFLARLADSAATAAESHEAGARAVRAVGRLHDRYGGTTAEFGHWHGDWVPWNLGTHGGRLVAWDWEHSGSDVPVGFDLAHDAFQRALILAGRSVPDAVRAADDQLNRFGERLGLGPEQRRLVVDGYLLEMWLRTWRLASGGAGWNEMLHPALLEVVENRQIR